jgi:hypothetical protein
MIKIYLIFIINVANISIISNGTIDGISQLTRVSKPKMYYIPKIHL